MTLGIKGQAWPATFLGSNLTLCPQLGDMLSSLPRVSVSSLKWKDVFLA